MKRFAAHYLLLPDVGFIRQQVVEIADEGYVRDVFPLTEEIESVEWMPGLIALLPVNEIKNTEMFSKNISVFQFNFPIVSDQTSQCFKEALAASEKRGEVYKAYPCKLSVLSLYDTDGLEGLYVPKSSFRETSSDKGIVFPSYTHFIYTNRSEEMTKNRRES